MARVSETIPTYDIPAQQLFGSIRTWLLNTEDHLIQPSKSAIHYQNQKHAIFSTRLPASWASYQQYRNILQYEVKLKEHKVDRSLYEKTLNPLMKVCALGRAAFVLEGLAQGAPKEKAATIADGLLETYAETLKGSTKLPAYRLLDLRLPEAIDSYTEDTVYGKIKPTMLATFAFAGVGIMQEELLQSRRVDLPAIASL